MPSLVNAISGSLALLCATAALAGPVNFSIVGDDPAPWPRILSSLKSLLETGESLVETRRWPEGV